MEEQTTQDPVVEEKNSEMPKNRGMSLGMIMSILLFVAVAIALFFYFQNRQLKNMLADKMVEDAKNDTPTETDAPPVLTDSWKLYQNNQYNFEFKYPETYTIEVVPVATSGYTQIILNKSETESMTIKLTDDFTQSQITSFLDTSPIGEAEFGDYTYYKFSLPNGYGNSPENINSPIEGFQTNQNDILLTVAIFGSGLTEIQAQILSTFKFSN